MNCFDRTFLQEYTDNEIDAPTAVRVDSHLQNCEKCRELLKEVKSDRELVLEFLSQLDTRQHQQKAYSRRINTHQFLKAAAGIALLIGLFWIVRNELTPKSMKMDEAELLFLEMMSDTEPNRSWHDGQTLIVYTDENGEVIQSFVKRN